MRKSSYLALCLIFINVFTLKAQINYFAYFETSNKTPFSLRISNNTYSSSIAGHLILPKLANGKYNALLEFPKKLYPSKAFEFEINNEDVWLVFDLLEDEQNWNIKKFISGVQFQNIELATTDNDNTNKQQVSATKQQPAEEKNIFAETLGNATGDKELATASIDKVKNDNKKTNKASEEQPIVDINKNEKTNPQHISIIKTKENLESEQGAELSYTIKYNGFEEVVDILIPLKKENKQIAKTNTNEVNVQSISAQANSQNINQETMQPEPEESTPSTEISKQKTESISSKTETITPKTEPKANNNCSVAATHDDYENLYAKLLATKDKDERMNICRAEFKKRCYSCDDIRSLAKLYRGKEKDIFDFLLLANRYVVDRENFVLLKDLLKEEDNIEQFDFYIKK